MDDLRVCFQRNKTTNVWEEEESQERSDNNDPNVYLCTCIGVYTFNTFDIQLEKHLFNT